jgi:hypothetical protein
MIERPKNSTCRVAAQKDCIVLTVLETKMSHRDIEDLGLLMRRDLYQ